MMCVGFCVCLCVFVLFCFVLLWFSFMAETLILESVCKLFHNLFFVPLLFAPLSVTSVLTKSHKGQHKVRTLWGFFFINMSHKWIFVISCVQLEVNCLPVCPSIYLFVFHGKNFYIGECVQMFQPSSFTTAMPIDTIDLFHFTPLSWAFTFTESHKVGRKQNLLVSFLCLLLNWSGWNLMRCWSNSRWASW